MQSPEELKEFLEKANGEVRGSYRARHALLFEHYRIEQNILAGGYGYRQILELVQNGADAVLEATEAGMQQPGGHRVEVLLRDSRLYVANTGAALSQEGIESLMLSHASPKRGNQIGRFGIGFKSLLKLDGTIDVFTGNHGGIHFNPTRCQTELRQEFQANQVPGMRLAWFIEPRARSEDAKLAQLSWAETVVRVDIGETFTREHLELELEHFPAEFLLFFPVPLTLALSSKSNETRLLSSHRENDTWVLRDGNETSIWRVVKRDVHITDPRAHGDATHIHSRETVPVAWAIPLEGKREEAGRFWAFFPTHTATFLPGIVNAPWKLNSDRNAIIGGEWNCALMQEAAKLIADTLPSLSVPEDPGRILDAFPRQLERKDVEAAPLVSALWDIIRSGEFIPDASGKLRHPAELLRPPQDWPAIVSTWQQLAPDSERAKYVHGSCLERQRAARLGYLNTLLPDSKSCPPHPNLAKQDVPSWFAAIASTEFDRAAQVLNCVKVFSEQCKREEWAAVCDKLPVIPTQSGKLVNPLQAVLAPSGTDMPGREVVLDKLYEAPDLYEILRDVLKVPLPDDNLWVSILKECLPRVYDRSPNWARFWACLRQASPAACNRFIGGYREQINVLRNDQSWVGVDEVLAPGVIVSTADTETNRRVLVHGDFHRDDGEILNQLKVKDTPNGSPISCNREAELSPWFVFAMQLFYAELKPGQNPSIECLGPSYLKMPRGWKCLSMLSGMPNALFSKILWACFPKLEQNIVYYGHSTQRGRYPCVQVPHPLLWFLLNHGTFALGENTFKLAILVARYHCTSLQLLPAWNDWSGAFETLAQALPFPSVSPTELTTFWEAVCRNVVNSETLNHERTTITLNDAAADGFVPESLPTHRGLVSLNEVYVTDSQHLAVLARKHLYPVLILNEVAIKAWLGKGARNLEESLNLHWNPEPSSLVQLLQNVMPELSDVISPAVAQTAKCRVVSGLSLGISGTNQPIPCSMWNGTLFLDSDHLSRLSRQEQFRSILNELASAGWLSNSIEASMNVLFGAASVSQRRAEVAAGRDLPERLLLAVGTRREPLLEVLGHLKILPCIVQSEPLALARLVLDQFGPAALTMLQSVMEAEGLAPPQKWGTDKAREFVRSIGFPDEFASSAQQKREAEEMVSGPIELRPLHDFQDEILKQLKHLYSSSTSRRRAVVSLPTGGGKTRVMVEAAVRLVLAPTGQHRRVLWVAQTDELCEQAVEAFRQVWVNLGAQRTDLLIYRMWGGNPSPSEPPHDKPVVVVATIPTLNNRFHLAELEWLSKPALVVVDECHHAITPSYTGLLRWLNAEAKRPSAPVEDEPMIIGLSATPFRTDDEESHRLARRFDNRWLPADQEGLLQKLINDEILARADYEEVNSGTGLLEDEIEQLASFGATWEGLEFDNLLEKINQRLGDDEKRNECLIRYLSSRPERSILFFSNSVKHAEEISARLNLNGIRAAAVSGGTSRVARRFFLDQFRNGEIRVLCNHSVLSTGFDAPKTELVLIARQVFSPVRYMQMVGRGLRGIQNGGTPTCCIATVMDNLGRFSDKHPYHYCRKLYEGLDISLGKTGKGKTTQLSSTAAQSAPEQHEVMP